MLEPSVSGRRKLYIGVKVHVLSFFTFFAVSYDCEKSERCSCIVSRIVREEHGGELLTFKIASQLFKCAAPPHIIVFVQHLDDGELTHV